MKRNILYAIILLFAVVGCVFLFPCLGQTPNRPETYWLIYWLRFHRTLLAAIAGGGLALSGLLFQALFRNPLATPYTLGVASGAAFGAAVFLRLGSICLGTGLMTVSIGAFAGSLLAMGIVLVLSRSKDISSEQMLLAGVAVNFFFSSMTVLLQYLSAPHDALQILRWTMGGVQNAMLSDNLFLGPIVLISAVLFLFVSRPLNVIVTGEERAKSLGVNVVQFRTALFVLTSLLVGAIVSATGPIGFVGLMIPHVARLMIGPDHRLLIPATCLLGAVFLPLCDTFGRCLFYPTVLPVGIITSLLGGPFFLWMLLKRY